MGNLEITDEFIRQASIALTEFCFRTNGELEDLHAENRPITNKDMMQINKYMVNHIAFILKLIRAGETNKLQEIINFYYRIGSTWDDPEIDDLRSYMKMYGLGEDI